MEIQEFNEAVGKIMGVKSGVLGVRINKNVVTGEWIVMLDIKATESQIKKLMPLIWRQ